MKFVKPIKKGQSYSFSLVGNLVSSEQFEDPYNQAERLSIYANLQGKNDLLAHHKKEWGTLWESDIILEDDPQAQ
ncbi:hypothetical protein [Dysgonomonas sp. GY617]|uniref:hypothetical protein n=1 Tax=Dysgonomonas sp. GY617 TaxID=2780420 RepID=UPI001F557BAD|nr:hypothetical protein [Dysgonomonas sp. GY617]